jgi:hypothetical protein
MLIILHTATVAQIEVNMTDLTWTVRVEITRSKLVAMLHNYNYCYLKHVKEISLIIFSQKLLRENKITINLLSFPWDESYK